VPFPLPEYPDGVHERVRILPPLGCPGDERWVVPSMAPGWLALEYRAAPLPPEALELWWLPAPEEWNDPPDSAPVLLHLRPRQALVGTTATIHWGSGAPQVVPLAEAMSGVRHLYSSRTDLMVTVTVGAVVATLAVSLAGCPYPPEVMLQRRQTSTRPLTAGAGLQGDTYDGVEDAIWQVRLQEGGGLRLISDGVTGAQSLALEADAGRGTLWFSGDGPPPGEGLAPTPRTGDFYLDRLSGTVYELTA